MVAAVRGGRPGTLPILPRRRARAGPPRAGWPLNEVRDPFALEVHRPVQPNNPEPGLPELPGMSTCSPRQDAGLGGASGGGGPQRDRGAGGRVLHGQDPGLLGGAGTAAGPARTVAAMASDRPIPPGCRAARLPGIAADRGVAERGAVLPGGGRRRVRRAGRRRAPGAAAQTRPRAPVLVPATMWPQFWDNLTARSVGSADVHAQARELLAGHDITVPAAFTASQAGTAQEGGRRQAGRGCRGSTERTGDPVPARRAGAAGPVP